MTATVYVWCLAYLDYGKSISDVAVDFSLQLNAFILKRRPRVTGVIYRFLISFLFFFLFFF